MALSRGSESHCSWPDGAPAPTESAALESGRFTQESIDWFLALLRDTPTMRNEIATTPRIILPLHGMNERVLLPANLLAGIQTPARFVWGEDDPNGGAEIARQFVGLFPNAELELMSGVGHPPWMDDPDRCAGQRVRAPRDSSSMAAKSDQFSVAA